MRQAIYVALLSLPLLTLGGCKLFRGGSCHEPAAYEQARSIPPLQLPEGLESPNTADALRIPPLNAPEAPRPREGEPCLEEPPPYSTPKQPEPQA